MDTSPNPKLDELLELTKENNKLLHKLYRAHRLAILGRVLYWVIIIGIAVGAFYFIQPYIDQLKSVYMSGQDFINMF